MPQQKLTMTVREVYYEMRAAGIRTNPKAITAGIISGLYPFGNVINVGETGRHTLLIFRVDFEAWLESKRPKRSSPLQLNPYQQGAG